VAALDGGAASDWEAAEAAAGLGWVEGVGSGREEASGSG